MAGVMQQNNSNMFLKTLAKQFQRMRFCNWLMALGRDLGPELLGFRTKTYRMQKPWNLRACAVCERKNDFALKDSTTM
jgi:hypothetical protein